MGELPANLTHGRGHRNADSLEHLAAGSLALGADGEPFATNGVVCYERGRAKLRCQMAKEMYENQVSY